MFTVKGTKMNVVVLISLTKNHVVIKCLNGTNEKKRHLIFFFNCVSLLFSTKIILLT